MKNKTNQTQNKQTILYIISDCQVNYQVPKTYEKIRISLRLIFHLSFGAVFVVLKYVKCIKSETFCLEIPELSRFCDTIVLHYLPKVTVVIILKGRIENFAHQDYGSTGCLVFKRGVQNSKDFCLRINILKGNH